MFSVFTLSDPNDKTPTLSWSRAVARQNGSARSELSSSPIGLVLGATLFALEQTGLLAETRTPFHHADNSTPYPQDDDDEEHHDTGYDGSSGHDKLGSFHGIGSRRSAANNQDNQGGFSVGSNRLDHRGHGVGHRTDINWRSDGAREVKMERCDELFLAAAVVDVSRTSSNSLLTTELNLPQKTTYSSRGQRRAAYTEHVPSKGSPSRSPHRSRSRPFAHPGTIAYCALRNHHSFSTSSDLFHRSLETLD